MSRYRKITTICCAAVFALGLSACGGGDDGISVADRDAAVNDAVDAEKAKTDALQMQIDALRAQLDLDPAGDEDLGDSIKDLQDEVTRLQGLVTAANEKERMEQEEADRMAAAKTGKELFAALAGTSATTNALANIGEPTLSTDLTIDAAAGAGTRDSTDDPGAAPLKAGDPAMALGSWNGMNYAYTNTGTEDSDSAVVYTNRGAPTSKAFADMYTPNQTVGGASSPNAIRVDGTDNAPYAKVMADAFTHSGTQGHDAADKADAVYVRGTYDGAPGEYRCQGTDCSSTNDGKGSPSSLGGTWDFTPDAGAMVSVPDANYLYYGWWVSKDKDGMPTAASAFTGANGALATALSGSDTPDMLTGSAMYAGHAAGKFALDYSKNKLLDGASDGGHFTADVMLSAKFGESEDNNDNGMTGTIDNFMANGESVPWSVALHRAKWNGNGGAFEAGAADSDGNGTTWSIDGTSAPKSGEWKGNMYDEAAGAADDDSNVPTTVTGTFYSQFESVGRMVGAFGANKQ